MSTINRQSAAKLLSILYGESSTTIPRKGSTILSELEKEGIKSINLSNLKDFSPLKNKRGIYLIFCTENCKWYIGSSKNFYDRMRRHRYYLLNKQHHSLKLQRAYNKHGLKNFYVIFIDIPLEQNLFSIEEEYIKKFNSVKNGFNMTDVCKTYKSFNLTEEQVLKRIQKSLKPVICLDLKGNFIKEYRSVTEASKELVTSTANISLACKSRTRSCKGYVFIYKDEYDPLKDNSFKKVKKVLSESHRQKLSFLGKTKPRTEKQIQTCIERSSKKVYKYDLNNRLIKEFDSMKQVFIEDSISGKVLGRLIKTETSFGGFYYRFNKDIVYSL